MGSRRPEISQIAVGCQKDGAHNQKYSNRCQLGCGTQNELHARPRKCRAFSLDLLIPCRHSLRCQHVGKLGCVQWLNKSKPRTRSQQASRSQMYHARPGCNPSRRHRSQPQGSSSCPWKNENFGARTRLSEAVRTAAPLKYSTKS